ncbi:GNAT family N-acetyltransferase [Parasphingopyxis marina]|uniref:GNAT family N-acetyltransferase n=1 Tax=Parasphingopyxis marina TaxID=2761622 RepID=A0A842HR48_9SPHN|nr:GNAT family N-acetyltransferase [Parasphingopyxis marina]MBC2776248.1 GNAT family N-acetyltransferase [Parasphingopyxis marina]
MLAEGYTLTDDQARIDAAAAHAYLTRAYWSPGISADIVARAIANSHCVAIGHGSDQVAMARVITDWATFAYLADVYVLEDHRGRGLSKAMLAHLHADERLKGLRRWALFTQDAHGLYEQFGWRVAEHPDRLMLHDNPEAFAA